MDIYQLPFEISNKMLDLVGSIMEKLGLKSKESFRENYLNPALENRIIKMTLPDKPTSKNQMYYRD